MRLLFIYAIDDHRADEAAGGVAFGSCGQGEHVGALALGVGGEAAVDIAAGFIPCGSPACGVEAEIGGYGLPVDVGSRPTRHFRLGRAIGDARLEVEISVGVEGTGEGAIRFLDGTGQDTDGREILRDEFEKIVMEMDGDIAPVVAGDIEPGSLILRFRIGDEGEALLLGPRGIISPKIERQHEIAELSVGCCGFVEIVDNVGLCTDCQRLPYGDGLLFEVLLAPFREIRLDGDHRLIILLRRTWRGKKEKIMGVIVWGILGDMLKHDAIHVERCLRVIADFKLQFGQHTYHAELNFLPLIGSRNGQMHVAAHRNAISLRRLEVVSTNGDGCLIDLGRVEDGILCEMEIRLLRADSNGPFHFLLA